MSALHDGEHFLIERYAVVTTPGLSLTDPRPLDRRNLQVFASGLSASVQGFPALAYVPAELGAIHALYGGEVLLDENFGVRSFLLTWDGRLGMDRLGEAIGHTRFRERPIELLTLSACDTAQGNERAALGLAGLAIQAGARSALGTLWSVNDVASAELVGEFYGQLHAQPVSKAVALQRAQQKILGTASQVESWSKAPYQRPDSA